MSIMRFHTIHLPVSKLSNLQDDSIGDWIENIVAIKEGFCWPAFVFNIVWAIWKRLWLVAIVLSAITLFTILLLDRLGADQNVILISYAGIVALFGFHANDFRRTKLKQNGYLERGLVFGLTGEGAIRRYLAFWKGRQ